MSMMISKRVAATLAPRPETLLTKFNNSALPSHNNNTCFDIDENKYARKPKNDHEKNMFKFSILVFTIYCIKRIIFPLSHAQLNFIDNVARNAWLRAEQIGIIEKFPPYKLDYDNDFPYFSLLEEHYIDIRDEVIQLLETRRKNIPRLKDLVENERKVGKVYKTDWKVFWMKMGTWIPENEHLAPRTYKLLQMIPDVTNAFFSILEPHQHIDPHWGHYKGFLRYHLGLIVPNNNVNKDCYLRIRNDIEKNTTMWLYEREELLEQGVYYYWHEGEGVMFDDNPLHDATNNSDGVRVVLFIDVARKMPWYLDFINRIAIYVANQQKQLSIMRKNAILDENKILSVG